MTYPNSGRVVFTCYDQAGRVWSVRKDSANSSDVYAEAMATGADPEGGAALNGYHAMGGLERLQLESGKLTRKWHYNARGQMDATGVWWTPSAGSANGRMKLTLGYGSDTANNGNLLSQTIAVGGS